MTTYLRAGLDRGAAGAAAMALVGSSVGISHALVAAPLQTAQAIRYSAATVILLIVARRRGVAIVRPRGREWLWLASISATGLVLFNIAIVRGVAHTGPAMIAVAVACVPVLLSVLGPLLQGQVPRRQAVLAAVIVTVGAVLVEEQAGPPRPDSPGPRWRWPARRHSRCWPSRCSGGMAHGASRCIRSGSARSC